MKRFLVRLFTLIAAISAAAYGADDPKQKQDLTAVIALQGKPCGEVVSYVTQGDNDFVATCKDGNRYRVHVKDGRVVVEKR
jgi:hypothetical protein